METLDGEARLLTRLRAGEEAAFEELIQLYGGVVRITARRLLRNDADADEILQETFLSAFGKLDNFRGQASLGTWLRRIANNLSLMRLRARGSRPESDAAELLPHFLDNGAWPHELAPWAAAKDGPASKAMHNETLSFVRASIDRLPNSFRVVLILRELEGLSNTEIAEQLHISPDAVKTRIHRGRQILRTLLNEHLGADE